MKRTFLILIALLTLCLAMAAPASAVSSDYVIDGAGLLTNQERQELNGLAAEISSLYKCDVRIYIVDDMGTDDAYNYAKMVYRENQFGYGAEQSGILLVMSMKERDYALIAFGYGNTALTDHGRDVILEKHVLPLLKNNDYYNAFLTFLNKMEQFLGMARAGTPFDYNTDEEYQAQKAASAHSAKIAWNIIIPILVALIVCLVFRAQMKTARKQRAAANYIPEGGFVLTKSSDVYTHSTETRTKIEQKGGTSTDSSGFSGSSGKF